jgi:hypothetical protein
MDSSNNNTPPNNMNILATTAAASATSSSTGLSSLTNSSSSSNNNSNSIEKASTIDIEKTIHTSVVAASQSVLCIKQVTFNDVEYTQQAINLVDKRRKGGQPQFTTRLKKIKGIAEQPIIVYHVQDPPSLPYQSNTG